MKNFTFNLTLRSRILHESTLKVQRIQEISKQVSLDRQMIRFYSNKSWTTVFFVVLAPFHYGHGTRPVPEINRKSSCPEIRAFRILLKLCGEDDI